MPSNRQELILLYKTDTVDALKTLEYSWTKLKNQSLPTKFVDQDGVEKYNLDQLESWEALTARFARVTDIFLSKYIRLLVLELDPGFRGEMRDYLDKAEKTSLISSADQWMKIRELRNKIAHEYTKEDLIITLGDVTKWTPFVLSELKGLKL